VFVCEIVLALSLFLAPLCAPSIMPYLYLVRIFFVIMHMGTIVHPLINDYVCKESRGKANALQTIGSSVGDLFNYLVILKLVASFSTGD